MDDNIKKPTDLNCRSSLLKLQYIYNQNSFYKFCIIFQAILCSKFISKSFSTSDSIVNFTPLYTKESLSLSISYIYIIKYNFIIIKIKIKFYFLHIPLLN